MPSALRKRAKWVALTETGVRRLVCVAVGVLLVATCAPAIDQAGTDPLRGTYVIGGGGAATDVVNALIAGFAKQHPKVRWQVQDVGSRPGMELVRTGGLDLAMSSAKPDGDNGELKLVSLGIGGVGILVNAKNPLKGLSHQQVRDVFSGKITDWSDLGGNAGRILVAIRQESSAIRASFTAFFFDSSTAFATDAIVLDDLEQTLNIVRSLSNAVSMVRITTETREEPATRLLALDGVSATRENVLSGAYKAQRPLYLVYNSLTVKPAVRAFLDFVQSAEGDGILSRRGP